MVRGNKTIGYTSKMEFLNPVLKLQPLRVKLRGIEHVFDPVDRNVSCVQWKSDCSGPTWKRTNQVRKLILPNLQPASLVLKRGLPPRTRYWSLTMFDLLHEPYQLQGTILIRSLLPRLAHTLSVGHDAPSGNRRSYAPLSNLRICTILHRGQSHHRKRLGRSLRL